MSGEVVRSAVHLRVVRDDAPAAGTHEPAAARRAPDSGDLVLVTALFVLSAVPVGGELARIGQWSPAIVGFAAGALLLTGRELWSQLRARVARKTERDGSPP